MPRGGGHFGGHHHHVGGGGGWHHHHHGGGHFHHHHRPYRGGVVFTGWWYPGYYSGRRAYFGFGLCWIIFFIAILIVILSVSLTTEDKNQEDDYDRFNLEYAPLETRLISVSQTFCDGIELENPSQSMPATLYVLYNSPPLTKEHNYSISTTVGVGQNSYQYWNYYLHHGSSMNASICVEDSSTGEFYVIQGIKCFQDWQDGRDCFAKFIITRSVCPQRQSVNFNVDGTDDYFFAYAADSSSMSFETTMNFHRRELAIVQKDIQYSCTAGGASSSRKCAVSVPYKSKRYFLIATGNTSAADGDEDGAAISWSCKSRVWIYMVAFFVPAIFGIIVITLIFIICCIRQRKRNSSYTSLLNDDTASAAAPSSNATTVVTTTTAPPSAPPDLPPPPYPTVTSGSGAYPPMPQSTFYPTVAQNYGGTDKPL